MDRATEIRNILKNIAGGGGSVYVTGEVVSVESETCTVKIADRLNVSDVRLNASANGNANNILAKPVVGSMVVMADLSSGELRDLVIIAYSEIDTLTVKFAGEVVINEGKHEGLVNVIELTEKLNAIEKDINNVKQVFKSWSPVVYDGGAALKAAIATWAEQQLKETKQDDIEDKLIKH